MRLVLSATNSSLLRHLEFWYYYTGKCNVHLKQYYTLIVLSLSESLTMCWSVSLSRRLIKNKSIAAIKYNYMSNKYVNYVSNKTLILPFPYTIRKLATNYDEILGRIRIKCTSCLVTYYEIKLLYSYLTHDKHTVPNCCNPSPYVHTI